MTYILLPELVTDCCGKGAIESTEHVLDGKWWGRCLLCKEMAELVAEEVNDA